MRHLLRLFVARDGVFSDAHLVWRLHLSQLVYDKVDNWEQHSTDQEQGENEWCREEL